jgi:DnaD/phage-associated family protein
MTIHRPNAFRLYEQNIGPLTPLIADQISRAIEEYPDDWIEDALSEAVAYNRRSWRYVTRILENWQAAGRKDQED